MIKKIFHKLFIEHHWHIAIKPNDNSSTYEIVKMPRGFWGADPFVFSHNGEDVVFFEYVNIRKNKAVLACCKIDDIKSKEPTIIYEFACHTSYPCVFTFRDTVYMIPETCDQNNIVLLKCVTWPYKWELESILLNSINAVDTTVFEYNEKLYAFIYDVDTSDNDKRTLLLGEFNDSLNGFKNVRRIKEYTDRGGRPGGCVYYSKGLWFRYVQPFEKMYGERLDIYKFYFNEKKYEETLFKTIKPNDIKTNLNAPFIGIHTYSYSNRYSAIDLFDVGRFNFFKPFKFLFTKLALFGYDDYDRKRKYITKEQKL